MSQATRPKFTPTPHDKDPRPADAPVFAPEWVALISCDVEDIPVEIFEKACSQIIDHPEYNSTLILRSETVAESRADFPSTLPSFTSHRPVKNIRRRLLPRRPGRDEGLEQHCTFYAADSTSPPDTLVLTPILAPDAALPYYHPTVAHLAFRRLPGRLRIDALPLAGTPTDPASRLYRTALALLETLHRYAHGIQTNYHKRVAHDVVVARDTYQDVYLLMRERHRAHVQGWKESTDPRKHVFEVGRAEDDIGIATFLMLLWKDMFPPVAAELDAKAPWKTWGRPPGGFVDLGCGNGLLVHILVSEGYAGTGLDVRARHSWAAYPPATQAALHTRTLDPLAPPGEWAGAFLVGNHADELTPWVPVLAARHGAAGYLSIPCCAWTLDERFARERWREAFPGDIGAGAGDGEEEEEEEEEAMLARVQLGTEASAYAAYRAWLARLGRWCGWRVEVEVLRIPSTRNWAVIGRTREGDEVLVSKRVEAVVEDVRARGLWKARTPGGKSGDH